MVQRDLLARLGYKSVMTHRIRISENLWYWRHYLLRWLVFFAFPPIATLVFLTGVYIAPPGWEESIGATMAFIVFVVMGTYYSSLRCPRCHARYRGRSFGLICLSCGLWPFENFGGLADKELVDPASLGHTPEFQGNQVED